MNKLEIKPIKLHCIGNQWSGGLDVTQNVLKLTENDMHSIILNDFSYLDLLLSKEKIQYQDLKSALIPPNGKNHFDFLFIFDYSKGNNNWFGMSIFKKIFAVILKSEFNNSKNSIFSGDLLFDSVSFHKIIEFIEKKLDTILFPDKANYFTILISNLTEKQKNIINYIFENEKYYIGAVDITLKNDYLKSALLLPLVGIKYKNKFLIPSVEDGFTSSLECTMPNDLTKVYINDYFFDTFLHYNYHSYIYPTNKDYALNILNCDKGIPISNFKLVIEKNKFENYLKKKKEHVIKNLNNNEENISLEEFTSLVEQSLSNNIFNIEINQYIIKFNTILDTQFSRMIFCFEYNKAEKIIRLITAY